MLRLIRWALSTLLSLVLLWAYFFVPIGGGERTLWDHTRRIWATPEAQALRGDIDRAGHQVATKIRDEVIPAVRDHDAAASSHDAGAPRVINRRP